MKILVTLLVLLTSVWSRADAWDNLTLQQAEAVVKFLNHNPYIIDYCDCCGESEPSYLIKVQSSEIVECAWDKKQYSVVVQGVRIARFEVTDQGINDYHTSPANREVEYTIYMNYTFGYDHHMKWAVPLHKLVDYPNDGPICFGATIYPDPSLEGVQIEDEDYIIWYNKYIKP
jgi:hypothetical protein